MVEGMERLKDQVVIITGGGSGIGKTFALAMAKEGARVVIADVDLAASESTAREVREQGAEALALRVDDGPDAGSRRRRGHALATEC